MHQAYQQMKPDSVHDMQELFLTGLAGQVDNILETVVKTKDEVLEQLDEMKNKNIAGAKLASALARLLFY